MSVSLTPEPNTQWDLCCGLAAPLTLFSTWPPT